MARVVYFVEHVSYGDLDERTGWYLMRATIVDDRGAGIARGSVVDRKPLAMFDRSVDGAMEARQIQDAARAGVLFVLPREWTIVEAAALMGEHP